MSAERTGVRLTDEQRLSWLRLIRSENIGPVTFRELINHFGSAASALEAVPDLARRGGRTIRLASLADAEREWQAAARAGARFVALGEPDYPAPLRHIDGAPPLLTVRGDAGALHRPTVSVVGARNASLAGRKFAMQVARGLGERGYVIASGLARGIDASAHEAALDTGTVAVFAGGVDRVYPPENAELAERIVERNGALISEMPMAHEPRARDFPRRNRIVAGLALGVVIVEAARQSGSLITARLAAEQGRLVFAVPGSPLDPRAAGSNRLIRDGAHIVTDIDDIVAGLDPMLARKDWPAEIGEPAGDPGPADPAEGEREKIASALGPTPVTVDELVRFSGARPAVVHLVLLELDLAGRLERHAGPRVSLIDP
ncbi:MAG TPA: DNA-processing protein DprA [Bauldia sp.]|nr:DNA-processing protein DprA [Bauldia sp.]